MKFAFGRNIHPVRSSVVVRVGALLIFARLGVREAQGAAPPRMEYEITHQSTSVAFRDAVQVPDGFELDLQPVVTCRVSLRAGLFNTTYTGTVPCTLGGEAWWKGGATTATISEGDYTLFDNGEPKSFRLAAAQRPVVVAVLPTTDVSLVMDRGHRVQARISQANGPFVLATSLSDEIQEQVLADVLAGVSEPKLITITISPTVQKQTPFAFDRWPTALCDALMAGESRAAITRDGWSRLMGLTRTSTCAVPSETVTGRWCERAAAMLVDRRLSSPDGALEQMVGETCGSDDVRSRVEAEAASRLKMILLEGDSARAQKLVEAMNGGASVRWKTTVDEVHKQVGQIRLRQEFLGALEACEADATELLCGAAQKRASVATPDEVRRIQSARSARIAREKREEESKREQERRARESDARSMELIPHAELCAKTQIYNQLRAPSTASFQTQLLDRDPQRFCYAFKVTVDAQNGFGAYVRSNHCVILQLVEPWTEDSKFRAYDSDLKTLGAFGLSEGQALQSVCYTGQDNIIATSTCR